MVSLIKAKWKLYFNWRHCNYQYFQVNCSLENNQGLNRIQQDLVVLHRACKRDQQHSTPWRWRAAPHSARSQAARPAYPSWRDSSGFSSSGPLLSLRSSGSFSSFPGRVSQLSSLEDWSFSVPENRCGREADHSPSLHSELQIQNRKNCHDKCICHLQC